MIVTLCDLCSGKYPERYKFRTKGWLRWGSHGDSWWGEVHICDACWKELREKLTVARRARDEKGEGHKKGDPNEPV